MSKIDYGDKMIKLVIYHWTNDLENFYDDAGNPLSDNPKAAWSSGTVNVKANKSRGIRPHPQGFPFNRLQDLPEACRKARAWAGISLYQSRAERAESR
jgi:hypothetical protein